MKKFLRFMIVLFGLGVGPIVVIFVDNVLVSAGFLSMFIAYLPTLNLAIFVASGILSGIIAVFISKGLAKSLYNLIAKIEQELTVLPVVVVVSGGLGLIVGLFMAFLLSFLFGSINVPWISTMLSAITYIVLAYLGIKLGIKRKSEFSFLLGQKKTKEKTSHAFPKILDTSVIIDGRIFDLCKSGFIEGTLIIPEFVLSELRHIADSADSLKRNRGRRGLDILAKIQKELNLSVQVSSKDYEDTSEVDVKLLKLAKEIEGKVLTNDYNLNKVASVQSVMVLNINELANAIKPVVLPGEEMVVTVIKEGRESGQGIAYLDDGTMIVVEGGKDYVGVTLHVTVTSVLQTAAGRMIFTKINDQNM